MSKITKSIQFGDHTLTLETGEVARQASAAVMVSMAGTVVLVTAVGKKEADEGRGFFPLTVNYQERGYAAGKVPGGFIKREGRPSENETLVSRLIDRPIRPLFPEGFVNEIQVIATVLSMNPEVNPDILALIGASAALCLSGIPFDGPIGAARVGYKDGIYLLNPSKTSLVDSDLDLVVAGTEKAILMVESEAAELSEEIMLGAVMFGHQSMQAVIRLIKEMASESGVEAWSWQPAEANTSLETNVRTQSEEQIKAAYLIRDKQERYEALKVARDACVAALCADEEGPEESEVLGIFSKIEKNLVRDRVLSGEPRIDGRDTKTVRPITIRTGLLPRTHGSALFTRGETQAIVVTTLGTESDAQVHDSIHGERKDDFMLHYNFPPYCVGEVGMMMSPKRREIGHGYLARRGVISVLPTQKEFPYVLRVVSEITESNGSSSMATVCGTSLALMDAGVPIKAPVAGIAMGLVKEDDRYAVLTDILGDEDHLGDMDFKVAGTENGVTALQMDIKIDGITEEIMQTALKQALDARLHILKIMNNHLNAPREDMSEFAPRVETIKINPDKIRDVIGKGGATIRSITEETGVSIDISDDGVVKIYSPDQDASDQAVKRIKGLTEELEVGKVYEGKITKIVDFGAFVNVLPGKDGLLHISQISSERIENVSDVLSEGQEIKVKVLDVDRFGKVKLSMKALEEKKSESTD